MDYEHRIVLKCEVIFVLIRDLNRNNIESQPLHSVRDRDDILKIARQEILPDWIPEQATAEYLAACHLFNGRRCEYESLLIHHETHILTTPTRERNPFDYGNDDAAVRKRIHFGRHGFHTRELREHIVRHLFARKKQDAVQSKHMESLIIEPCVRNRTDRFRSECHLPRDMYIGDPETFHMRCDSDATDGEDSEKGAQPERYDAYTTQTHRETLIGAIHLWIRERARAPNTIGTFPAISPTSSTVSV